MKKFKITYKEYGRKPSVTFHTGELDKDGVIQFFGLNDPDIEWYKVEEIA